MGGNEEWGSRSGGEEKGWAPGVALGLTWFTGEMVRPASVQSGMALLLPEQLES